MGGGGGGGSEWTRGPPCGRVGGPSGAGEIEDHHRGDGELVVHPRHRPEPATVDTEGKRGKDDHGRGPRFPLVP